MFEFEFEFEFQTTDCMKMFNLQLSKSKRTYTFHADIIVNILPPHVKHLQCHTQNEFLKLLKSKVTFCMYRG